VGIPEQKLFDFTAQYRNLNVTNRVRVGTSNSEEIIGVDAVTGATVTVMVVNETLMRSALKVAQALEIAGLSATAVVPPATIRQELYQPADWATLTKDGSIRRLRLDRGAVDQAFRDTDAADVDTAAPEQKGDPFIDLFYAPLNVPTLGRNLLGDSEYQWLMKQLQPGDQAIAVFGKGRYSFKGNGYVRGGIFDRLQLQQASKTVIFHDTDYQRLSDVYIEGFPGFDEMVTFIIRAAYEFDPGAPWQLELLVRRQVGALDSVFTSFYGDYQIPERYIERPAPPPVEQQEPEPLWVSVWLNKQFQITVLVISLVLLTAIIFLQDWLVRYPKFLHNLRHLFLAYTVIFIGWYTLGQLSIVNVLTFVHAIMADFSWQLFLLDPVIFILWAYVAVTLLLWGRGIFCGWLCPFGALQDLLNQAARKLGIRQFEPSFAVHERLWAVKYIILLALFGISLESLGEAERYAEVEPFKTAIMLKFQREWGYVLYAGGLLFISLFTRKFHCRYLCPLGRLRPGGRRRPAAKDPHRPEDGLPAAADPSAGSNRHRHAVTLAGGPVQPLYPACRQRSTPPHGGVLNDHPDHHLPEGVQGRSAQSLDRRHQPDLRPAGHRAGLLRLGRRRPGRLQLPAHHDHQPRQSGGVYYPADSPDALL
jgi:NosR/NirI family nitrous oxide reductase transcriptional regulator